MIFQNAADSIVDFSSRNIISQQDLYKDMCSNLVGEDSSSKENFRSTKKLVTNGLLARVTNGLSPIGSSLISGGLRQRIGANRADTTTSSKQNPKLREMVGPRLCAIGSFSSSDGLEHGLDVIRAGNANISNENYLGSSCGVTNGLGSCGIIKGLVPLMFLGQMMLNCQTTISSLFTVELFGVLPLLRMR
ncbi:hypothetical protein ACOSP7_024039 [Xanthoceras sorbifolium]